METMGMEVLVADFAQGEAEERIQGDIDNVKQNHGFEPAEPIKAYAVDTSDGKANGPGKGDVEPALDADFQKDAVDEHPAPKGNHYFYFVRFQIYEDPELKAEIELAEKEIQKMNQARLQLIKELKWKRSDRRMVSYKLCPLNWERNRYRSMLESKRNELRPLHAALAKLRRPSSVTREEGVDLCSSEGELNVFIKSLCYLIQHGNHTLLKEKQLLRDIKLLEGTREKVIANASTKGKIQYSFDSKEVIQDKVELIGVDLAGVRNGQQAVRKKIEHLEEEMKQIGNDIRSLEKELVALNQQKAKTYDILRELRKEHEEGNAVFYQNQAILNHAKELAAKTDIATLGQISHSQVEKFMEQWSRYKAFRENYKKRILPSLNSKQLSRDGRMRNPDEKPLVIDVLTSAKPKRASVKRNTKTTMEDAVLPSEHGNISFSRVQAEGIEKSTEAEMEVTGDSSGDNAKLTMTEQPSEFLATTEIDAAMLKDKKREERISKANMASTRKKNKAQEDSVRNKNHQKAQDQLPKIILKQEKSSSYWLWAIPPTVIVLMLVMLGHYSLL